MTKLERDRAIMQQILDSAIEAQRLADDARATAQCASNAAGTAANLASMWLSYNPTPTGEKTK